MGVTGLWPILGELCERKPLSYLTGKKVSIDLSGWVVQATQCKGLNTSRNPHLRNLFFRVSRLLQNGVHPIFVIEGKPPALKKAAFNKRNGVPEGKSSDSSCISRSDFDRILQQCQNLLKSLGVPCLKSSGEGEALCAFLCLNGVVDGVITEDNDAFLYGADDVYRDFSMDPNDSHVNMYSLKSHKNKFHFDRAKLVALALLLGCDYVKGVPGVGKETVLKLLDELKDVNLLQRFSDWKQMSEAELFPGYSSKPIKKPTHCSRCSHPGSNSKHKKDGCEMCDSKFTCYLDVAAGIPCTCTWHKNTEIFSKRKFELKIYNTIKEIDDFPNKEVIKEYMSYLDKIPDEASLDWNCPNLNDFQEKAFHYLGWTIEYSLEKCLPIITSWQQFKLGTCFKMDTENFIYEPVKILKERTVKGEGFFEVQWKSLDTKDNCDENLHTLELTARFSKSYPDLVQTFFKSLEKEKEEKQAKRAKPKVQASCRSRKFDEILYFHLYTEYMRRYQFRALLRFEGSFGFGNDNMTDLKSD